MYRRFHCDVLAPKNFEIIINSYNYTKIRARPIDKVRVYEKDKDRMNKNVKEIERNSNHI